MKIKNKKIIIGIIVSLTLISSISVLASVITHYTDKYSKNSILSNAVSNYNTSKLLNNKYSVSPNTLINNLTYINKYINSTLIVKEKLLKLSILGGRYDKSDKYKNDKKRKRSELAQFSHALKHVHRYGDQVGVTIDNSTTTLTKESGVISQIIPIIQDHPYTYNSYLNKLKISIPNISFFVDKDSSISSNNLNNKTSDISNNSYGFSINNTNLNSITFSSEENGVGAKTMYSIGSSIYAAAFTKISFQANIITFDNTTNSFKYETPTAKVIKTGKTSANTRLDSDNSEISNGNPNRTNSWTYFNSSRTALTSQNSSNNALTQNLPTPLTPNYLPDYFNTQLSNAAEAKINYNHISSFKNNHSLYYPAIFIPIFMPATIHIIGSIICSIVYIPIRKKAIENERLLNNNTISRLNQIERDITMQNLTKENYSAVTDGMYDRLDTVAGDLNKNPFKYEDRNQLLTRLATIRTSYNTEVIKTAGVHGIQLQRPVQVVGDDGVGSALDVPTDAQNTHKSAINDYIREATQGITSGDTEALIDAQPTLELLNITVEGDLINLTESLKKIKTEVDYIAEQDKILLTKKLEHCVSQINDLANIRRAQLHPTPDPKVDLDAGAKETLLVQPTDKQKVNKHDITEDIEFYNENMNDGTIKNMINGEQTVDGLNIIADSLIHPLQHSITKIETTKDFVTVADENVLITELQNCIEKINNIVSIKKGQINEILDPDSAAKEQVNRKDMYVDTKINEHKDKIDKLDDINDIDELDTVTFTIDTELNETYVYITKNEFKNKFNKTWLSRNIERLEKRLLTKTQKRKEVISKYPHNIVKGIEHDIVSIQNEIESTVHTFNNIQDVHNFMKKMSKKITQVVRVINNHNKSIKNSLIDLDNRIKALRANNDNSGLRRIDQLQQLIDENKISISKNLKDKKTELQEQKDIIEGVDKPSDTDKELAIAKKNDLENEIHFLEKDLAKIKTRKDNIAPFVTRELENVLFV